MAGETLNSGGNSCATAHSAASVAFLEKLAGLRAFRLHTGNINGYSELKCRRFKNSAEELSACLELQLQSTPLVSDFKENGTLLLCDADHTDNYERDDLKITMKVYLSTWSTDQLRDSVTALLDQLRVAVIELLIISPPELTIVEGESEEAETKRWVESVAILWTEAEKLVAEGKVVTLGISDASLVQLRSLCERHAIPSVNHVSTDSCCVVSPELSAFASQKEIQLLTHTDPIPFPTADVFKTFCTLSADQPVCYDSRFQTTWAARYTVWVRRRSIMASKGYIVQLQARD